MFAWSARTGWKSSACGRIRLKIRHILFSDVHFVYYLQFRHFVPGQLPPRRPEIRQFINRKISLPRPDQSKKAKPYGGYRKNGDFRLFWIFLAYFLPLNRTYEKGGLNEEGAYCDCHIAHAVLHSLQLLLRRAIQHRRRIRQGQSAALP